MLPLRSRNGTLSPSYFSFSHHCVWIDELNFIYRLGSSALRMQGHLGYESHTVTVSSKSLRGPELTKNLYYPLASQGCLEWKVSLGTGYCDVQAVTLNSKLCSEPKR